MSMLWMKLKEKHSILSNINILTWFRHIRCTPFQKLLFTYLAYEKKNHQELPNSVPNTITPNCSAESVVYYIQRQHINTTPLFAIGVVNPTVSPFGRPSSSLPRTAGYIWATVSKNKTVFVILYSATI